MTCDLSQKLFSSSSAVQIYPEDALAVTDPDGGAAIRAELELEAGPTPTFQVPVTFLFPPADPPPEEALTLPAMQVFREDARHT